MTERKPLSLSDSLSDSLSLSLTLSLSLYVTERKLGNHLAGQQLKASVTVVNSSATDGVRSVTLSRPLRGATAGLSLSVSLSLFLSLCLSVSLSLCLSVSLSFCLSVYLSDCHARCGGLPQTTSASA